MSLWSLTVLSLVAAGAPTNLPPLPDLPRPPGGPLPPGPVWTPPLGPGDAPAGAPRLFESTAEAPADASFFVTGDGLTDQVFVWGCSEKPEGQSWPVKVQLDGPTALVGTLPATMTAGPCLLWVRNDAGWSRPLRFNIPDPWLCGPAHPGRPLAVFGRQLGRLPDRSTASVWLTRDGRGQWLTVHRADKYSLTVELPDGLEPGDYQLWVHAGWGGEWGWSEPLAVTVTPTRSTPVETTAVPPAAGGAGIQAALDKLSAAGGGAVILDEGTYVLDQTLRVPAKVRLRGRGRDRTRLELGHTPDTRFVGPNAFRWNEGPGAIHTRGDEIDWTLEVPAAGTWRVWVRYATHMEPWGQPGMSGKLSLRLAGGQPTVMDDLPNTGSFNTFRWSATANLDLPAGRQTLTWRNEQGGGINLDALVFARDPAWRPAETDRPVSGPGLIVKQAEDVAGFRSREGRLPGQYAAVVWLAGANSLLEELTISGNPRSTTGVLIQSPEPNTWLAGGEVRGCRIVDIGGQSADNRGIHLVMAERAVIQGNQLTAGCPLFLSGLRNSTLAGNELIPVTRNGRNALAAILGRTDVVEGCVIEGNSVVSPPDATAGGPTVMRMVWLSTGRGSISRNWIADNNVRRQNLSGQVDLSRPMRFGGVAGQDQNVGEMILFEGNHRTMYFGPLAGAGDRMVTLPETLPPTPDERLGSVKREQLAHDAEGRETPFWPPDTFDDTGEPPLGEYYVSIFAGAGQGQTRRVIGREGATLQLDRPWRVPPAAGSLVAVGTMFYRNLIVRNELPDGMTGVQLWISCVENVVAGNLIDRQRKEGIFLYANGTTLASSMPRTWNRGISPLFFNVVEGNRCAQTKAGVLVTSGDAGNLPVEFPRALGNVVRHNSLESSRIDGVIVHSRRGSAAAGDTSASVFGTLVEFNVVRDAPVAYRLGNGADWGLFRRNHAYFWYPVNNRPENNVAFQVDTPGARAVIGENSIEGIDGGGAPSWVTPEARAKE